MSESDTMFNERDRRCAAVQLMLSADTSYDKRTIASTLKMQIWIATNNRDVPRVMKTKFPATVMVFGVVSSEGHIMPPHIFDVYLDVWWSPVAIRWLVADPGCGSRIGAGPQVQRDPGLASLTCPLPLLPRPEPAGLLRLVIHREHHQHDLPQHESQPDHRHPPSIRWASAGACGKGMLPVPDPYRGCDWGWRQLHWIDVSSTT